MILTVLLGACGDALLNHQHQRLRIYHCRITGKGSEVVVCVPVNVGRKIHKEALEADGRNVLLAREIVLKSPFDMPLVFASSCMLVSV